MKNVCRQRGPRGGSERDGEREGLGRHVGDGTRGWHLNGDVLYVEPRRQNDSSKAASASTTKRQKLLKEKSIRRFASSPTLKLYKINRF